MKDRTEAQAFFLPYAEFYSGCRARHSFLPILIELMLRSRFFERDISFALCGDCCVRRGDQIRGAPTPHKAPVNLLPKTHVLNEPAEVVSRGRRPSPLSTPKFFSPFLF